MLTRLVGWAVIAAVLAAYVVIVEDGRPDAWRVAGFSLIGLAVGGLVFGRWDRRRASRDR